VGQGSCELLLRGNLTKRPWLENTERESEGRGEHSVSLKGHFFSWEKRKKKKKKKKGKKKKKKQKKEPPKQNFKEKKVDTEKELDWGGMRLRNV